MSKNNKTSLVKTLSKNIKTKQSVSRQSQLAERLLWLSRSKVGFMSIEAADKMVAARFEKNRLKRNLPKLKSSVNIVDKYLTEVYEFGDNNDSNRIIVYLHGGAYINQPARFHWKFVDKLVQATNINVIFPLYPKAPEYNFEQCYEYLEEVYNNINKKGYDEIIFIGDSAGAGLALGFSQYIKNKNILKPSKIILFSPWVDLTMENPKIDNLEKVDPMLSKVGLLEIGKVWANGTDLNDYRLSPLKGDLRNLGQITIYTGTHEIFLPDCKLLKKKAIEANLEVNYFEYKHMNHAFPLFPIPEANKVFKEIIEIIQGD